MDIYALLDQLEQLANSSKKIRFSNRIMVDENEFLDLVDQLRTAIPDEVRQSRRTTAERERILSEAHAEAERILEEARQEARSIVGSDQVIVEAQQQASQLLARATAEANAIQMGADQYAADVLGDLEQTLSRLLVGIRNGLDQLAANGQREPGRRA